MLPTKQNLAKQRAIKRANNRPSVHQKISNSFIENAISKSNLSALKIIYYLATILQDLDISNYEYDELIEVKIDMREMLLFTELTNPTLITSIKEMQETSITFINEVEEWQMGVSLLPFYEVIAGKRQVRLKIFKKIAELIIDVKQNYTPMNIKELMEVRNKHSLRFLALLCMMTRGKQKEKTMNFEELKLFFGVNYKTWSELERKILVPIKDELDNNCKISFNYEPNFENLGQGRPAFKDCNIKLKDRNSYQPKIC